MLTHSSHSSQKTNSLLYSSWMQNTSKAISNSQFQLVASECFPNSQNQAKTSQRHVADLENIPGLLKTFTFTTTRSNLQLMAKFDQNFQNVPLKSNMFADISSVPCRPKHLLFAPNSLLKASNISKFLQWSQNDQILPNCQQSRQKHLVSSRNFSFLWKMPFRLLKVKRGAMCGTSSGIYPFTPPFAVDCTAQKSPPQLSAVVTGHIDDEVVSSIHVSVHMYSCTTVNIVQQNCNTGHIDHCPVAVARKVHCFSFISDANATESPNHLSSTPRAA